MAPSPDAYLEVLTMLDDSLAAVPGFGLLAVDLLRPYQEVLTLASATHRATCRLSLRELVGAGDTVGTADGAETATGVAWSNLTTREEEVLVLLLGGASSREIADNLFISCHTVSFHVKKLMRKFDASSRVALVAKALPGHMLSH